MYVITSLPVLDNFILNHTRLLFKCTYTSEHLYITRYILIYTKNLPKCITLRSFDLLPLKNIYLLTYSLAMLWMNFS